VEDAEDIFATVRDDLAPELLKLGLVHPTEA
jgi:hypothetical protein